MKNTALPLTNYIPLPEGQRPKGIALLLHGLNLLPSQMDSLAYTFHSLGFASYRVSLCGHREEQSKRGPSPRLEALKEVTAQRWLDETIEAWSEAKEAAQTAGLPLVVVGFSMGGLLASLAPLEAPDHCSYEKRILFAPALCVRPSLQMMRPLLFLPRLVIPSASPAPYKANWGTSMAAYKALFDLLDRFKEAPLHKANRPTLVMMDRRDELLSAKKLEQMIQSQKWDQWSTHWLQKKAQYKGSPNHLIIDKASVGSHQWQEINEKLQAFLTTNEHTET